MPGLSHPSPVESLQDRLSWGTGGNGNSGPEGAWPWGWGKDGRHLAEEGALRREEHAPGRLILFLQLQWGCAVSQPGQGSTAEPLGSARARGFVLLPAEKGPPQRLKALWKKPKHARKANQTWTAAGHFGFEQRAPLTSSKLYFLPEVSPCLSLMGSFSAEKRLF